MNSTEIPDDCNDTIEPAEYDGGIDSAAAEDIENTDVENTDIENHVRRGPGSIEALRFKWTVRRASNGYYVDETIGESRSAFSSGPMPRDTVIAFIDARERDACERLEQTRQKFAAAMPVGVFSLAGSFSSVKSAETTSAKPAETAPLLSPEQEEPIEAFDFSETPDVEISTEATKPDAKDQRPGVNVDDVMDRIARLLDER